MNVKDVHISWNDINLIEKGYKVYRSNHPMDVQNMPESIGSLPRNSVEYIDKDQVVGDTLYYRVSAWIDGYEQISEEVEVLVSLTARGTGGIESVIVVDDTYYRIHEFTTVGNSTFNVEVGGDISYLIVGGGGGGSGGVSGDYWGSGGGGAEVIWGSTTLNSNTYTITVGDGGLSATSAGGNGQDGQISSAFGVTARAGYGGIGNRSTGGTSGTGFSGGIGTSTTSPNRGGGGGAGATKGGSNGGSIGGNGGDGMDVSNYITNLFGDNGWFGGGGAGFNGDNNSGGIGGKGGGASPTTSNNSDGRGNGLPNTGGGAGERMGKGGSGTVIVRYPITRAEYEQSLGIS